MAQVLYTMTETSPYRIQTKLSVACTMPSLPNPRTATAHAKGITLVEVAVTVAIIAVFIGFALATLIDFSEDGDARTLQSDQAMLQGIVLQASDRLNTLPSNVSLANVLNVMPANPQRTLQAGASTFTHTMAKSGRGATLRVNGCGQVCVTTLNGYSKFTLQPSEQRCTVDPAPCPRLTQP